MTAPEQNGIEWTGQTETPMDPYLPILEELREARSLLARLG